MGLLTKRLENNSVCCIELGHCEQNDCALCGHIVAIANKLADYEDIGSPEEFAGLMKAKQEGRLDIIDKNLFCRNASKRDGKCAGYNKNRFTHETLPMCNLCNVFDLNYDDEEYYDDSNSFADGEKG